MSKKESSNNLMLAVTSFVAGAIVASIASSLLDKRKRRKQRKFAGAACKGKQLAMFYGDKALLNNVAENKKFLDADFYAKMVHDCVICCLDCLVIRQNSMNGKLECLLVERGSEPVKGVWWLPGGRIYKGETFFDAAIRKVKEETGLIGKPIQVLGFYNTFFDTSHWDTATETGTQSVQPVVLVELKKGSEVVLDTTSERFKWIVADPDMAEADEEDRYVVEALRRMKAYNETFEV